MAKLNLTPEQINSLFPVCGVVVYERALVVRRSSVEEWRRVMRPGRRGLIESVSRRSLNKLVLTVSCSSVVFTSLLTLTYGQNYPISGKGVKADVNKFVTYLRRAYGHFEYFWFMEFQARGSPHLHFGLDFTPCARCDRPLVASLWADIVEEGDWPYTSMKPPYGKKNASFGLSTKSAVIAQHQRVKTWEAIRSPDGAIRYCIKYATKLKQKTVPKMFSDVGRFWATSRGVKAVPVIELPGDERGVREMVTWLGRDISGFEVLPQIIFHSGNLPESRE